MTDARDAGWSVLPWTRRFQHVVCKHMLMATHHTWSGLCNLYWGSKSGVSMGFSLPATSPPDTASCTSLLSCWTFFCSWTNPAHAHLNALALAIKSAKNILFRVVSFLLFSPQLKGRPSKFKPSLTGHPFPIIPPVSFLPNTHRCLEFYLVLFANWFNNEHPHEAVRPMNAWTLSCQHLQLPITTFLLREN